MEKNLIHPEFNLDLSLDNSSNVSFFEMAKAIYKGIENNGGAIELSVQKILKIRSHFKKVKDFKGYIFCCKALSIIYVKHSISLTDINEQIHHQENALSYINEALIEASESNWQQPSLLKQQAIVKSKLSDLLHKIGNHEDADLLVNDALDSLTEMLNSYNDYPQGYLEMAEISVKNLKWTLKKASNALKNAERLFKKPKHTKHLPDTENELPLSLERIKNMRRIINQILFVQINTVYK